MGTRLTQVVIDALDPRAQARFWAGTLGWEIMIDDPSEVEIAGGPHDVPIDFVPSREPKRGKNRMHIDIAGDSVNERLAIVDRCLDLGATRCDIGQGDVPWTVLADPEGNEFCVIDHVAGITDTGPVRAICLDADDVPTMRDFWCAATGWEVAAGEEGRFVALRATSGRGPVLVMGPMVAPKVEKNRIHMDVRPYNGGDHHAEAERLVAAGATPVDIGQRDVPWVVLADPEGNEFCVLTPRGDEPLGSTPT
jgi:predicted enzyme related to lactoylglutathione lyase